MEIVVVLIFIGLFLLAVFGPSVIPTDDEEIM